MADQIDLGRTGTGKDFVDTSSTRWVERLVPGKLAAPIHPGQAGMVGAANALLAAGAC